MKQIQANHLLLKNRSWWKKWWLSNMVTSNSQMKKTKSIHNSDNLFKKLLNKQMKAFSEAILSNINSKSINNHSIRLLNRCQKEHVFISTKFVSMIQTFCWKKSFMMSTLTETKQPINSNTLRQLSLQVLILRMSWKKGRLHQTRLYLTKKWETKSSSQYKKPKMIKNS